MTASSKGILGCLLALATSSAASAQDISTLAKVSAGTAAITAAVVLLHGHSSTSSTFSTSSTDPSTPDGAKAFTGSDIGRGGNTSGATFAGYGNNPPNNSGGSNVSAPLAPGGAAGLSNASSGYFGTDGSVFTFAEPPPSIIFVIVDTTATLATGSMSTSSTGTGP